MRVRIKLVPPEDGERAIQLITYCFPEFNEARERVRELVDRYLVQDAILGCYNESGILDAMLFIVPFDIYIYGSPLGMGGIAVASSMPEGRHGGKMAELLRSSLQVMKDRKQFVSMLGPFSYEFYRKYGWELSFERLNYTIPVDHLSKFKKKVGSIRPFRDNDLEIMDAIYSEYARRHNCCAVRDKFLWTEFVLDDPYFRSYPRYTYLWTDNDNNPQGYIVYTIKRDRMTIHEMIYLNQEAKEGLLWFIFAHQSQVESVYWSTSSDERLYLDLANPRVRMELSPGMMFRVVDVKNALLSRNYDKDIEAKFSISISDPDAEWNNKGFTIEVRGGEIDIKECDTAEVFCSIQTFSQVFTGYVTPEEALSHNKLTGDIGAIKEMNKIFYKSYTFNNNSF
mgnify:FL=1